MLSLPGIADGLLTDFYMRAFTNNLFEQKLANVRISFNLCVLLFESNFSDLPYPPVAA